LWQLSFGDVQIRAADSAGADLEQHLSRGMSRLRDAFDAQWAFGNCSGLSKECGFHRPKP
jgi:hypothetical protein